MDVVLAAGRLLDLVAKLGWMGEPGVVRARAVEPRDEYPVHGLRRIRDGDVHDPDLLPFLGQDPPEGLPLAERAVDEPVLVGLGDVLGEPEDAVLARVEPR